MACCMDTFVIFGAWQSFYCSEIHRKRKPYWPHWVGSSSEPSWQSSSPSHTQRWGMQWPVWHWKLLLSHVWWPTLWDRKKTDRHVKDVDVTYFTSYFLHLRVNESLSPVQLASSDQSRQSLSPSQRHASRIHTPLAQVNSPAPHRWDS